MVTFTKFGSCVSRDIFNFMDTEIWIPQYTFNCAISNMVNESNLVIDEGDIVGEHSFDRRMQKLSFKHENIAQFLQTYQSDYFLFDVTQERLPLQRWQQGSESALIPVTWLSYQTSRNILHNEKYPDLSISDWHLPDRDKGQYGAWLRTFCEEVMRNYDREHIIYISARQAKEFIDTEGRLRNFDDFENHGIEKAKMRHRQDDIIDFAEKTVLDCMPGIWVIHLPDNAVSDDRHHFKRHTLHFHHFVYEYFADCLTLIAKDRSSLPEDVKKKLVQGIACRKMYCETRLQELLWRIQ